MATPAPVVQVALPLRLPQRLDYGAAAAFGTAGREVQLYANHFSLVVADKVERGR
jgi:hypothetical protein